MNNHPQVRSSFSSFVPTDLTGEKYGDLTVTGLARATTGKLFWNCKCSCGNTKEFWTLELKRMNITHCGCKP